MSEKTAIAREILSRREQAKGEAIKRRFAWLGGVVVTLGLVFAALKRLWMQSTGAVLVKHVNKP